eukprot:scaffold115418_cov66-Attheya_sp.AAC.3
MSTCAANRRIGSATPAAFGEAIFRKNIVTGHTLAGCNKIPSSTKGLCDLTDLDLAITIAVDTGALSTLVATLSLSKIERWQSATTNQTEHVKFR